MTDSLDHDHVTVSKSEDTLTDAVEDVAQRELDTRPSTGDNIVTHTETAPKQAGSTKHVTMVTKNRLLFRI